MVVDFGRSAFTRKVWFFSAPQPLPATVFAVPAARFARGLYWATKPLRTVRWYFAAPGALPLPFPTFVDSSDWLDASEAAIAEYGELPRIPKGRKIEGPPPPEWIPSYSSQKGAAPPGASGQYYCGRPSDFLTPKPWSPNLPSLNRLASGLPTCCAPLIRFARALGYAPFVSPGGLGLGGGLALLAAGGLGLGGEELAGGLGLGGEKLAGGLGLGGEELAGGLGLGGDLALLAAGGLGLGGEELAGGLGLGGEELAGGLGLGGEELAGGLGLGGDLALLAAGGLGLGGEELAGGLGLGGDLSLLAAGGLGLGGEELAGGLGLGGEEIVSNCAQANGTFAMAFVKSVPGVYRYEVVPPSYFSLCTPPLDPIYYWALYLEWTGSTVTLAQVNLFNISTGPAHAQYTFTGAAAAGSTITLPFVPGSDFGTCCANTGTSCVVLLPTAPTNNDGTVTMSGF